MVLYGRAAAVINLANIENNIRIVKSLAGRGKAVMAVVKANGYGHGIFEVSRAAVSAGADWLGVATVMEGVFLRRWGIMVPILVLSPVFEEEYENLIINNLSCTVFSLKAAQKLAYVAGYLEGRPVKIHIKIDTGMNRIGYSAKDIENTVNEILQISMLCVNNNIVLEGIYSHLATSDSGPEFAAEQFELFKAVLLRLKNCGVNIPIKHISNSGGIINHADFNEELDLVRAGVLQYGLAPNSTRSGVNELSGLGFLPAMELKSRVAFVKWVRKGESVGYSRNYVAKKDLLVATVPLGYADGLSRKLSNRGRVLINGVYCDIVGNVCMDQFMVDATDAEPNVRDEVVIIGKSGDLSIFAEDIAFWQGSINYEVVTSVSERVPRFYPDTILRLIP